MSRLRNPELVLLHSPVPVTIGEGGLLPVVVLATVFAAIGMQAGLPIVTGALIGAIGGTASLVAHELGHVRAASKLRSLRPLSVSLIWLGAATRLDGAYASGRDQARVAIAGPKVSFVAAISLLPVLFLPLPLGVKDLVVLLAALNIAIGVLSLIPANPLDGYKLFVGLLWSVLGSEAAARRFIRRLVVPWIALEVIGAVVLLVEQPFLGTTALAIGASLYGQKLYARRHA